MQTTIKGAVEINLSHRGTPSKRVAMESAVLAKKLKRKQKKQREPSLLPEAEDAVVTPAVEEGDTPAQSIATLYKARSKMADDEIITATIQSPTADADTLNIHL